MRTCNFNYNNNNLDLNSVNNIIRKLIKVYKPLFDNLAEDNDKILLQFEMTKYIELIKNQKKTVIALIIDVIKFFPELKEIPHCIFLHGSFSKTLNRYYSDIDLNFLYPKKFKKQILTIEEIISVILQKVIGYSGRDKIHTMMLYTCKNVNMRKLETTKKCTITFKNETVYNYSCRPNFDIVMYKIKHSSREHKKFLHYMKSNISPYKCNEWCYSFELLFDNYIKSDFYNQIIKLDIKRHLKSKKAVYFYNKLLEKLIYNIKEYKLDLKNTLNISEINHKIKVRNLSFIYDTLALIRRYLQLNNVFVKNIDFFEIFSEKHFSGLFSKKEYIIIKSDILKYIWQLGRVENVFYKNNINFSSRNFEKYNHKFICDLYEKLYKDDLEKKQEEVTQKLHNSLIQILNIIYIKSKTERGNKI